MKTWIISELFYPDEVATGYYLTEISKKLNEEGEFLLYIPLINQNL